MIKRVRSIRVKGRLKTRGRTNVSFLVPINSNSGSITRPAFRCRSRGMTRHSALQQLCVGSGGSLELFSLQPPVAISSAVLIQPATFTIGGLWHSFPCSPMGKSKAIRPRPAEDVGYLCLRQANFRQTHAIWPSATRTPPEPSATTLSYCCSGTLPRSQKQLKCTPARKELQNWKFRPTASAST